MVIIKKILKHNIPFKERFFRVFDKYNNMPSQESLLFIAKNLTKEQVIDKNILDIGSRYINGSIKEFVMNFTPASYVGVDIIEGKNVDVICPAEKLLECFPEQSFDIIICSEVLEHVNNWKLAISNIKKICKTDGFILITVPSKGFPLHSYPFDYWRYENEDIKNIFSDYIIEKIEKNPCADDIFVKMHKPNDFKETSNDDYELYSILYRRRIKFIPSANFKELPFKIKFKIYRVKIKNYLVFKIDQILTSIFLVKHID